MERTVENGGEYWGLTKYESAKMPKVVQAMKNEEFKSWFENTFMSSYVDGMKMDQVSANCLRQSVEDLLS